MFWGLNGSKWERKPSKVIVRTVQTHSLSRSKSRFGAVRFGGKTHVKKSEDIGKQTVIRRWGEKGGWLEV